ncbi:MAG: 50S ribosomal protein L25/general stress protein Ctc [Prevotellaceae bacterium]|jgi:large subunit ribosomal protein L25|nr:50S ribosomal protein L25/general stress protein Ctc [Prevotellaceae bacterium]
MKIFELSGTIRNNLSKAEVKSLRNNGQIPCVLYGNKVQNIHFCVSAREARDLIYTPNSYIVAITIEGKRVLAVLHEMQFHPVTDVPLHIDFLAADESNPVTISIPVVIEGVSEGVKAGGKLSVNTRKLSVKGLIKDIPDSLPVSISDLKLGKVIVAGDLTYPNIQIVTPKNTIICAVKMTRAALGAAAAAAATPTK